ncbi:MAG: Rieske family ferredoxin, partial [Mesorhizobium sp.]
MSDWVEACAAGDIDEEDVMRFDHGGRTFAIYRSPDDEYFATDGLCTHEKVHLAGGLVMDDIIECPKHNGRFNYKTGAA